MMTQHREGALYEVPFALYCAGVYAGRVRFTADGVRMAGVDLRQRTQLQEDWVHDSAPYALNLTELQKHLRAYEEAKWSGEEVRTAHGARFVPSQRWPGETAGHRAESQLWACRDDTAVDVVTLDGKVIAFVMPYRYGMEVLVKAGFESLTPLTVYDDPRLSKPVYGVNNLGTFLVPMRDGVRLATDVYLPEGVPAATRLPAILVRTCYDRKRNQQAFMRWANRGYAVVNQDVRGRSDSEGELVPFYYERDDGSDTMDWISAQPWSNGSVGTWGASYLGYVAVAGATSGNPHLKAVVDEVNVGSPFVDTVRRGGTLCSWPLLSWTLAQSVSNRTDFDVFGGITVSPDKAVDARPIRDIPRQMIGKNSGPWDIWSQHPDYDDFWRNCTFTELGHQVTVPMLVISGWFDGDSAGVSETWRMLTEHDVPNRKIWLGAWEHSPNRARDLGPLHFSNDAVVYHYDVQVLRWFDRFLKEIPNGIDGEPRAEFYVMGENRWHTSQDWPPAEARMTEWHLGSRGHANSRLGDGVLRLPGQGDFGARSDTFVYDPADPVSDSGERHPDNLRDVELRNDLLVYTSEPLSQALTIAGELSADLYLASSAVDTDWALTLTAVDPEGNSLRLSSYIVRAQYRHGADHRQLLVPDEVEIYHIFLPNIAVTIPEGHRIRLSVTSSSKMVAFPNSNTGLNPYDDPEPVAARQTLYHTPEYPSRLNLPVLG